MPVSKLCLFYFLVIFCLGCSDNSSRNEPPVFEYEFKNQSGHKLTIQLIDEYGNFPNPLILENEESFSWGNSKHRPGFFPFQAKELCILEFDDIIRIYANQLPDNRSIFIEYGYQCSEVSDGLSLAVFVFTKEDYEYALEHPID
mgnify:FL=1